MSKCACVRLACVGLLIANLGCSSKKEPTYATYVPPAGAGGSGSSEKDASDCGFATGYEQVSVPDPAALTDDGHVAMVLDGTANPMVAWVRFDRTAPTLYFRGYDSGSCQWLPPITIDQVGNVSATRGRQVTMSRDPASGRLAIAYQVIDATYNRALKLAQSDDNGITWSTETVVQNPVDDTSKGVSRPTVMLRNGVTYFAYYQIYLYSRLGERSSENGGFILLSRADGSSAFSSAAVPPAPDATLAGSEDFAPSLALRSDGTAALAYFAVTDKTATNLRVLYYESGRTASSVVFDSLQQADTSVDVSLALCADGPCLAASLQRGADDLNQSQIWFARSRDGIEWSLPTELPKDGDDAMGPDLSLAVTDSALSIASNSADGTGIHRCGAPKLTQSTSLDGGADTWTTCGPELGTSGDITSAGRYVQLAYTPLMKRVAAFATQRQGVWVWREP